MHNSNLQWAGVTLRTPDGFTLKSGVSWSLSDPDWAWLGASASCRRARVAQHQAATAGVLFHITPTFLRPVGEPAIFFSWC